MTSKDIEKRKENIIKFLKGRKDWIQYVLLALILWLAFFIRKQNWHLLKDVTTGEYISLEIDSALFLRYAQHITEHGRLFDIDMLRNFPYGLPIDFGTYTSYFIAYLWKILSGIGFDVSVEFIQVIYPTIATLIATIFLFLLVRRLFDYRVALLSCLFLVSMPAFLFRSISSDHDILGLMFVFMTLYFFVVGWQSKNNSSHIIFGFLAAVSTVFGFSTAGNIKIFIMVVALFTLIHVLLNNVKESDIYVYPVWYLVAFGYLIISGTRSFSSLLSDYSSGLPATFAFVALLLYFFFNTAYFKKLNFYNKLNKIPTGFLTAIFTGIIGVLFFIFFIGFNRFIRIFEEIFNLFTEALVFNRWASTVAENRRVFIVDWFSTFGSVLFWLFIAGLIILLYLLLRDLKNYKRLFYIYAVSVIAFIFSKYSQNSALNGQTSISRFLFYGSVFVIIFYGLYYYLTNYYTAAKDNSKFSINLNWRYLFVVIIALMNVVGGTTAIRLFFELSPFFIIVASFTLVYLFDYFNTNKHKILKYGGLLFLFLLLFSPFSFAKGIILKDTMTSYNQVKASGPAYHQQWQEAGQWVRENTPEDSIFVHWWDYGYWVQGGFERTTVTDGGNRIWWWNYLTARNLLTAPNDENALGFLYAHNVSYFLAVSDEIGKYSAYSLIGSDKNYDRYSFITVFGLNPTYSREEERGSILVYSGGFPLEEDIIYQDLFIPKGSPVIAAVLPVQNIFNGSRSVTGSEVQQPYMIIQHLNQPVQIPLKCVYIDRLYSFDNYSYNGCLRVVPSINGQNINNFGAAVFLSSKVVDSLFSRFYILNQDSKYFELVYDNTNQVPLALLNGNIIGPTRIWKVEYPEGFSLTKEEHEYYNNINVPDPSLMEF